MRRKGTFKALPKLKNLDFASFDKLDPVRASRAGGHFAQQGPPGGLCAIWVFWGRRRGCRGRRPSMSLLGWAVGAQDAAYRVKLARNVGKPAAPAC